MRLEIISPHWFSFIDAEILGTIRDCEETDFGWRGIMWDGNRSNVDQRVLLIYQAVMMGGVRSAVLTVEFAGFCTTMKAA
jgi:hypothetical protein